MREEIWAYDYAVIRVVPRVEREEFVNVGVILSCPGQKFLNARIETNLSRLKAFAPDLEPETVERCFKVIQQICAGETGVIGQMKQRERFYWLTAVRSTIIQMSPVHPGFCADAEITLENIFNKMVR